MTTPFVGEIQLFGFNFAPRDWAFCNGQTLPISQNTALFSLLGTNYGGNGQTTFQLPNLMARTPCNQGRGPGLTARTIGESFGEDAVTLSEAQMPQHSHDLTLFMQTDANKVTGMPANGNAVTYPRTALAFTQAAAVDPAFADTAIGNTGGSQAHENRQPYLAVNFCIALAGAYPNFV